LTPGSSPKPPTPCSTPQPTGDTKREDTCTKKNKKYRKKRHIQERRRQGAAEG